jgi:hypothetical protein
MYPDRIGCGSEVPGVRPRSLLYTHSHTLALLRALRVRRKLSRFSLDYVIDTLKV